MINITKLLVYVKEHYSINYKDTVFAAIKLDQTSILLFYIHYFSAYTHQHSERVCVFMRKNQDWMGGGKKAFEKF